MLEKVEPQRLRDELVLDLKEEKPLKEIRRIQELAGFDFINPGMTISNSTYRLLGSIDNQVKWFRKNYPQRRELDTWLIYFMGLIDSLSANAAKSICEKFAFRRGEQKRIITYKKINRRFILGLGHSKIKPSKIFSLLEPLSYEVIILLKSKYKNPNIKRHIEDFLEIYNGMRLYISGHDLHRLGTAPGPHYQKIFGKVLNAKIDRKIKTREEELELVRKLIVQ